MLVRPGLIFRPSPPSWHRACGRAFQPAPLSFLPWAYGRALQEPFPPQVQLLPWACGRACGCLFLSLFGLCGPGSLLGRSLFRYLLLGGLAGALCRHLEIKHAHGRQSDGDALLEAVERLLLGADSLVVDSAGTAERLVVAVQDLLVGAGVRCAQGVALAQDGVEVADHKDLLAVCILAQEATTL